MKGRPPLDRPPLDADRQALAVQWRGLAWRLARRYAGAVGPGELDDLRGIADLALVEAAASYDGSRETAFPIYAEKVIRGRLRSYLYDLRRPLGTRNRNVPPPAWSVENLGGRDVDDRGDDPFARVAARIDAETVLGSMTRRQAEAVRLHYFEGLTMTELGGRLGLSKSRALWLATAGIGTARKALRVA